MRVEDRRVGRNRAFVLLAGYATNYADTAGFYDLAGDPGGQPGPDGAARPVDAVALADIGRLVAISAGLAAADVARLLEVNAAAEFAAVPPTARLEDWQPARALDDAATPV